MINCFDRAVGTFSRALDTTSAVRQPSLHMSAAAASRDITLVSCLPICVNVADCVWQLCIPKSYAFFHSVLWLVYRTLLSVETAPTMARRH